MSLTVLCGLSIATNNCLALVPYGKGLKMRYGESTAYKQMGTKKRKRKHMEPVACVWKPGGSTEADVCPQLPWVKKEAGAGAPVLSYLEVMPKFDLNESQGSI